MKKQNRVLFLGLFTFFLFASVCINCGRRFNRVARGRTRSLKRVFQRRRPNKGFLKKQNKQRRRARKQKGCFKLRRTKKKTGPVARRVSKADHCRSLALMPKFCKASFLTKILVAFFFLFALAKAEDKVVAFHNGAVSYYGRARFLAEIFAHDEGYCFAENKMSYLTDLKGLHFEEKEARDRLASFGVKCDTCYQGNIPDICYDKEGRFAPCRPFASYSSGLCSKVIKKRDFLVKPLSVCFKDGSFSRVNDGFLSSKNGEDCYAFFTRLKRRKSVDRYKKVLKRRKSNCKRAVRAGFEDSMTGDCLSMDSTIDTLGDGEYGMCLEDRN